MKENDIFQLDQANANLISWQSVHILWGG